MGLWVLGGSRGDWWDQEGPGGTEETRGVRVGLEGVGGLGWAPLGPDCLHIGCRWALGDGLHTAWPHLSDQRHINDTEDTPATPTTHLRHQRHISNTNDTPATPTTHQRHQRHTKDTYIRYPHKTEVEMAIERKLLLIHLLKYAHASVSTVWSLVCG